MKMRHLHEISDHKKEGIDNSDLPLKMLVNAGVSLIEQALGITYAPPIYTQEETIDIECEVENQVAKCNLE